MEGERFRCQYSMITFATVLICVSPFFGAAFAYRIATRGHLRKAGGFALVALLTSGSVGLALSMLLITGASSDILTVLGALAGLSAAVFTAGAIYAVGQGWLRRLMLVSAGLLLSTGVSSLSPGVGLFYTVLGWTVYFTLAIYNPPLRESEVGLPG
jgi:hypothetical protein